jgi:hypothetical protein
MQQGVISWLRNRSDENLNFSPFQGTDHSCVYCQSGEHMIPNKNASRQNISQAVTKQPTYCCQFICSKFPSVLYITVELSSYRQLVYENTMFVQLIVTLPAHVCSHLSAHRGMVTPTPIHSGISSRFWNAELLFTF